MTVRETILEKIFRVKKARVAASKLAISPVRMAEMAEDLASNAPRRRFSAAIRASATPAVIAEFKRASPSKGIIEEEAVPGLRASEYQHSGAAAVSVLTEEDHFRGSLADLSDVVRTITLPVLRKDFIFDPYQVDEAKVYGADAVLLIAAMLNDQEMAGLMERADALGLDSLLEVHDRAEMERAASLGAGLIGVNNRDLRTFEVSLETSRALIARKPAGSLMIAESGITSMTEIEELSALGYAGFLIGEALMRRGFRGLQDRNFTGMADED